MIRPISQDLFCFYCFPVWQVLVTSRSEYLPETTFLVSIMIKIPLVLIKSINALQFLARIHLKGIWDFKEWRGTNYSITKKLNTNFRCKQSWKKSRKIILKCLIDDVLLKMELYNKDDANICLSTSVNFSRNFGKWIIIQFFKIFVNVISFSSGLIFFGMSYWF